MRKYPFLHLASTIVLTSGLYLLPAEARMASQIVTRQIEMSTPNLIKVQDYLFQEYQYNYPPRAQHLTYEEAVRRATPYARQPKPSASRHLYTVAPNVAVPSAGQYAPVDSPCSSRPARSHGRCGTSVLK